MGILDFLNNNQAGFQGLTALGQALSQAGAPSMVPMSTSQRLGMALPEATKQLRGIQDHQTLQDAFQAPDAATMMAMISKIQDPDIQKALVTNRISTMMPKYEMAKDAMGNPIAVNSLDPSKYVRVGGNPLDTLNSYPGDNPTGGGTTQPGNGQAPVWQSTLSNGVQSPQGQPTATIASPQHSQTGIDQAYLAYAKQNAPLPAAMAESMINGTFKQEAGKGENDPNYVMALQIAKRADPTFGPQSLIGRPQMVENSTKGNMYTNETNLNTSMAHLYDLHQLAPLVNNSPNSSQPLNSLVQLGQKFTGGPAINGVNRYKSSLTTAAPEIAKYLGGGAATDTSTAEAQGSYSPTLPTATIQGNALDLGSKMMAKAGSLQNEYDTTMGAAGSHKVANPTTLALFADMQGKQLTPQQQQLVDAHRAESNLAPKYSKQGNQSPIQPGTTDYNNSLLRAKSAISKNPAARAAILQKLQDNGISTQGL